MKNEYWVIESFTGELVGPNGIVSGSAADGNTHGAYEFQTEKEAKEFAGVSGFTVEKVVFNPSLKALDRLIATLADEGEITNDGNRDDVDRELWNRLNDIRQLITTGEVR